MADVRSLLKAKRDEQRIVHPFAAYSQSGALRCTVCDSLVKHAPAWNGHLGSKLHRNNVARLKQEEERRREEERIQGKRKSSEDEDISMNEPSKKRRLDEDDEQRSPHVPAPELPSSGFPADFFSDPSKVVEVDDDPDEEQVQVNPPAVATNNQSALDLEWMKFQEAVINVPAADARETFERATIFAEPELSVELPEGFPSSVAPQVNSQRAPSPAPSPAPKDVEAERRRRAEEEKELIMDRLLDEERAQEEADERVNVLKAKFTLLKQKRMAAKAVKTMS